MQQEMYDDALYFCKEAERYSKDEKEVFVTWRNLRAAIIFSYAAVEACINQCIEEAAREMLKKGSISKKCADRWMEKERHVPIVKKLNEGMVLFGSRPLIEDSQTWNEFLFLRDLRNDLVHFKAEARSTFYNEGLLSKTKRGVKAAGAVIRKIHLSHPGNEKYPPVFDKFPQE